MSEAKAGVHAPIAVNELVVHRIEIVQPFIATMTASWLLCLMVDVPYRTIWMALKTYEFWLILLGRRPIFVKIAAVGVRMVSSIRDDLEASGAGSLNLAETYVEKIEVISSWVDACYSRGFWIEIPYSLLEIIQAITCLDILPVCLEIVIVSIMPVGRTIPCNTRSIIIRLFGGCLLF